MTDETTAEDELLFARIFEAPRELMFTCMITPEHLTHFWGPTGMSAPLEDIVIDARPGGAFETVMVDDADGSRYPTRGVFTEITEPERLVWIETDSGIVTDSTFVDLGDGRTELRIHQAKVPAAYRSPQAQSGFLTSLDRFAAYLESLSADETR